LEHADSEVSPTPLWERLWDPRIIIHLELERAMIKSFPSFLRKVDLFGIWLGADREALDVS